MAVRVMRPSTQEMCKASHERAKAGPTRATRCFGHDADGGSLCSGTRDDLRLVDRTPEEAPLSSLRAVQTSNTRIFMFSV
jgi:hypothetical protein